MIFADLGSGLAPNMLPGQEGSGQAPVLITSAAVPSIPVSAMIPGPERSALPTGTFLPPSAGLPSAATPSAFLPGNGMLSDIKWIVVGGVAFLALAGIILVLK